MHKISILFEVKKRSSDYVVFHWCFYVSAKYFFAIYVQKEFMVFFVEGTYKFYY